MKNQSMTAAATLLSLAALLPTGLDAQATSKKAATEGKSRIMTVDITGMT